MNRAEIALKVQELVYYKTQLRYTESSRINDDIGFDSLDEADLLFDCESEFGIKFSDAEYRQYVTLGELVDAIQRKLNEH